MLFAKKKELFIRQQDFVKQLIKLLFNNELYLNHIIKQLIKSLIFNIFNSIQRY